MTTKSKTIMVMQGLAFAVYWPITIDLVNSANQPPMAVLAASATLSLMLAVLAVTANVYRDRCQQDPVLRSLYNSFEAFVTITALLIIGIAAGTCRVLRMPPAERGGANLCEIGVLAAFIGGAALFFCWNLVKWRLARRRTKDEGQRAK